MKLTLKQRQILWAYAFMAVSLLFFIVIRWYPTVLAFNISFRDRNVFDGSGPWVGLENFRDIWQDLFKPRSPSEPPFGTPFATWCSGCRCNWPWAWASPCSSTRSRGCPASSAPSTSSPLSHPLSPSHSSGTGSTRPRSGLINQVLTAVGLPAQPFLNSPKQALPSIAAVAVWRGLGFTIIIFLAGLQQIPDIYYEAAKIDGANRWQMFWRVTLPLLNSVFVYLAVLGTIGFLRMFDLVQNMSDQGRGGPLKSTTTVVLEVYNEGFSSYNMGYAAALTVILFFVILLITVIQLRLLSRRVDY